MKITDITTLLYEYPLRRPIGDVHMPGGTARYAELAVFVTTDEPELVGTTVSNPAAASAIHRFREVLIGQDPRSVRGIWEQLAALIFKGGPFGPSQAALSALDCALWDLRAKYHEVPLWRELGASRGVVRVYGSALDSPLADEELVAFHEGMARRGVNAGKLKVGRDHASDQRRLGLMSTALSSLGAKPLLIVDANEFWSAKQAVQRIKAFESQFDLGWVEEPVRRWDVNGLRRVAEAIRAPVATGENLTSVHQYVPLITGGAVDVVQIGAATGGVTGALRVAELADAFDLPVTMGNCTGRFMAHVAAALPHHTMMEVIDAGRDVVLTDQPEIVDGVLTLADQPGGGIRFDMQALEKYRVSGLSAGTLATAYSRASDAGLIG